MRLIWSLGSPIALRLKIERQDWIERERQEGLCYGRTVTTLTIKGDGSDISKPIPSTRSHISNLSTLLWSLKVLDQIQSQLFHPSQRKTRQGRTLPTERWRSRLPISSLYEEERMKWIDWILPFFFTWNRDAKTENKKRRDMHSRNKGRRKPRLIDSEFKFTAPTRQ